MEDLQLINKYCPLCGKQNECMVGQGHCWCFNEGGFPPGIFELVPSESKGKHCICKKCVSKYREEGK